MSIVHGERDLPLTNLQGANPTHRVPSAIQNIRKEYFGATIILTTPDPDSESDVDHLSLEIPYPSDRNSDFGE